MGNPNADLNIVPNTHPTDQSFWERERKKERDIAASKKTWEDFLPGVMQNAFIKYLAPISVILFFKKNSFIFVTDLFYLLEGQSNIGRGRNRGCPSTGLLPRWKQWGAWVRLKSADWIHKGLPHEFFVLGTPDAICCLPSCISKNWIRRAGFFFFPTPSVPFLRTMSLEICHTIF